MESLRNLRERIKTLETERANLIMETQKLRKVADARVDALLGEVSMLREEVKSLRDLLGPPEEAKKQKPHR
jgi:regulator of replication initiation timing